MSTQEVTAPHALPLPPPRAPATPVLPTFAADARVVRAQVEAERLSWGHQHNPGFATEISLIDPLPHQRLAVYDHLLHRSRLRFLLADDAGAGKTIMTGLYLRERLARRLLRRVLIVPPAGLVGNWQRELRQLFNLRFRIIKGADAKRRNPFVGDDSDALIVSVDRLAGDRLFTRLQEPEVEPYDLVIFDEAHKLSADRDEERGIVATGRYLLAEALCGASSSRRSKDQPERWILDWACPQVLLLTATPHMGKDYPYYYLWRLLEPQICSTWEGFASTTPAWRAERFLRRTKEEMVRYDGSPLYPRRECHTVSYPLQQGPVSEQELYDQVTHYIEKYYNLSKILNRSAIRFAMSIFQRRLASSTYAIYRSLDHRLNKLTLMLRRVRQGELSLEELNRLTLSMEAEDPYEARTAEEEEGEDGREQNEVEAEQLLEAVVASSIGELEAERAEVARLKQLACEVWQQRRESKLERLQEWLSVPAYAQEKVLIFTEHRDTADFLVERLEQTGLGGQIASIHGGLDYQERDRQAASFNLPLAEGGARWMVATDAAAEGINLQRQCWLMVNYDIPWNPARLEQRMGRIHRYGQQHDPVIVLNMVSEQTREGRVMATLLEKLETIRRQLQSDKVFDVIGQVFEGLSLRDLMTSLTSEEEEQQARRRIEGKLTPEQVKALQHKEAKLYGDGGDVLRHLGRLHEQQQTERLRQLLPGHVAGFLAHTASLLDLRFSGDPDGVFSLEEQVPGAAAPLRAVTAGYPEDRRDHLTVQRSCAGKAIFVHPGEPVFELLHASLLARYPEAALQGGCFVDPAARAPYLLHIARISVVRRADPSVTALRRAELLSTRLVAVRQTLQGSCSAAALDHFLLLRPGQMSRSAPTLGQASALQGLLEQARHHLAEQELAADAEEQRRLRLHERADRRAAVVRGFAGLEAELLATFKQLKDKLPQGGEKVRKSWELVRERLRRLDEYRRQALAAIEREIELIDHQAPDALSFLAHALVLPSSSPEDAEAYDDAVEQRAMEVVIRYERSLGSLVRDVHTPELALRVGLGEWPGFDLEAVRPPLRAGEPGERRCIEVKGRAYTGEVELSYNEWAQAATLGDAYWLYAVFGCATEHPRLMRVQNPFARLIGRQFRVRIDDHDIVAAAEPEP